MAAPEPLSLWREDRDVVVDLVRGRRRGVDEPEPDGALAEDGSEGGSDAHREAPRQGFESGILEPLPLILVTLELPRRDERWASHAPCLVQAETEGDLRASRVCRHLPAGCQCASELGPIVDCGRGCRLSPSRRGHCQSSAQRHCKCDEAGPSRFHRGAPISPNRTQGSSR